MGNGSSRPASKSTAGLRLYRSGLRIPAHHLICDWRVQLSASDPQTSCSTERQSPIPNPEATSDNVCYVSFNSKNGLNYRVLQIVESQRFVRPRCRIGIAVTEAAALNLTSRNRRLTAGRTRRCAGRSSPDRPPNSANQAATKSRLTPPDLTGRPTSHDDLSNEYGHNCRLALSHSTNISVFEPLIRRTEIDRQNARVSC